MKLPRCIPTLTIKSLDEAVVLERIIQKTSINVVELTLREGYCLEGIDLLLNNKNIHVGLGTVYHPDQLDGINTDKIDFIVLVKSLNQKIVTGGDKLGYPFCN